MELLKLTRIWAKKFFGKAISSNLFWAISAYLSSVLLDVATANKYIANIMLAIAFMAFTQLLLEKLFGVYPPYIKKITKFLKINRIIGTADNPNMMYETLKESSESLKKIKIERMKKMLNKITKWLKLNYAPLLSFFAFILYVLDNYFDWTDKWGLPSEWYYAITAIIIIIVGIGIKSKGFKGITLGGLISEVINNFVSQKAQMKQENKERVESVKLQMKTQPMVDILKNTLKDEIMKELKGEQPPIIGNPNQPRTKEDIKKLFDEARANERNNQ